MIFVVQSLLGSLFLVLHTTLVLNLLIRSQELCARTMTMEDAYQVKITLQLRAAAHPMVILILHYRTRHFARHTWEMYAYYVKDA